MGAALVAVLGYTAFNHHGAANIPKAGDSMDLLGKHHPKHGSKAEKEEKHVMTRAEMNGELFDDRREFDC